MTFHYHPETDSLYIDLASRTSSRSEEVSQDVVLDFDSDGLLVGIDIDHASRYIDLTNVAIESLPLVGLSMTKTG